MFVTGVGCGLPTVLASLHQFLGPTRSLHYYPEQQTQSRTAQLGEWRGVEPERLKEKNGNVGLIFYELKARSRAKQHYKDSPFNTVAKHMMKNFILHQTKGDQFCLI